MNLASLPKDALQTLLCFLEPKDIARLGASCKALLAICCTDNKYWKRRYHEAARRLYPNDAEKAAEARCNENPSYCELVGAKGLRRPPINKVAYDLLSKLNPPRQLLMMVLGDNGVGKSSLVMRFIWNRIVEDFGESHPQADPFIEDEYLKNFTFPDCNTPLLYYIHDTAVDEFGEYSPWRYKCFTSAHAYLLVYSVTDMKSFESLPSWRKTILNCRNLPSTTWIPMVLVGNKIDLKSHQEVPTAQAMRLAGQWGCAFEETSAKENIHVQDAFVQATREFLRHLSSQLDAPPESGKKNKCLVM